MRSYPIVLIAAIAVLLAAPAVAIGCSLAVQTTRPHIAASDLRFMAHHRGTRAAWVQDDRWTSSRVQLTGQVQPRFLRRPVTAAFAQQRSLSLLATRPADGVYGDDADPATTCALAGQRVYAATLTLVRETERAVFVTVVSRRTEGSTDGCSIASTSCDDLVIRTVRLDAPIGERRLYAVTFA